MARRLIAGNVGNGSALRRLEGAVKVFAPPACGKNCATSDDPATIPTVRSANPTRAMIRTNFARRVSRRAQGIGPWRRPNPSSGGSWPKSRPAARLAAQSGPHERVFAVISDAMSLVVVVLAG